MRETGAVQQPSIAGQELVTAMLRGALRCR